ncbi:MAG: phage holin family protein [Patescibacteria group bacterium]|nr:phage holin family protein [Patescibacteria group bacterium]MCL5431855.1 phage holin family protein [Patescibacteria group bacterium]
MIKGLIRSYLINLFALWVVSVYIGAFRLANGWESLLLVSAGFTLLHLFFRPIISIITGPLNFLSLGLVGLVIDAIILYGLTLYFPQVSIVPWNFAGATVNGFVIPAYSFSVLTGAILSAAVINLIRGILASIAS